MLDKLWAHEAMHTSKDQPRNYPITHENVATWGMKSNVDQEAMAKMHLKRIAMNWYGTMYKWAYLYRQEARQLRAQVIPCGSMRWESG